MANIISVPQWDPNSFLNVSVLTWHLSPLTWKIWISGHNRNIITIHLLPRQKQTTISISILSFFFLYLFCFIFFCRGRTSLTHTQRIRNHFLSFLTITQQKIRRKKKDSKTVQQRHQQQQFSQIIPRFRYPFFSLRV